MREIISNRVITANTFGQRELYLSTALYDVLEGNETSNNHTFAVS